MVQQRGGRDPFVAAHARVRRAAGGSTRLATKSWGAFGLERGRGVPFMEQDKPIIDRPFEKHPSRPRSCSSRG